MARPFRAVPTWPGSTVAIVAGGPSLSFAQVRRIAKARLEGRCRVIAVNDAVFWCWWADWLHACDAKWWTWHIQSVQHFAGIRTTLSETVPDAWVDGWLKATGDVGFDPDPGRIRHGSNSGYQALHLALETGASKIVLVGFDCMKGTGGQTHCHGGHDAYKPHVDYENTMGAKFPSLVPAIKARGVDVVNCSARTHLKCFRRASLEEVL
jgi:hypothetical protein